MTVKDSISINLANKTATIKSGCAEKYARKLINDWLKENTDLHGGWVVWKAEDFEKDGKYHFTLMNMFADDFTKFASQVR